MDILEVFRLLIIKFNWIRWIEILHMRYQSLYIGETLCFLILKEITRAQFSTSNHRNQEHICETNPV